MCQNQPKGYFTSAVSVMILEEHSETNQTVKCDVKLKYIYDYSKGRVSHTDKEQTKQIQGQGLHKAQYESNERTTMK